MSQQTESKKNTDTAKWSGSLGFIMAAAGSAVGMGNLWRFPMLVGENGGGAFVLVYLICIFLVGIPMIIAEITIGRAGGKDAFGSYKALNKKWGGVGILAVITSFIGLSYYAVLGGWVIRYIFASVTGASDKGSEFFQTFTTNAGSQIVYYLIFMVITILIVVRGIQKGIESSCKIMMPLLVLCMLVIVVRSCTLPGAEKGIEFFLKPDFSKLTPGAFLAALGQVFFSLSLGTGATITYGAYLGKDQKIVKSAGSIAFFDTLVAMIAGFAILPAVFAFGFDPESGPSLMFQTLPTVFGEMPGGKIFGVIFFVLVLFAAVSTSIAYLEVVVSFAVNTFHVTRTKAAVISAGLITCLGIPCALSFGMWSDIKVAGKSFFDLADYLVSNVSLPIGGILACIFIGWVWKSKNAVREITNEGKAEFKLAGVWSVLVKFVLPVLIAAAFVTSL
ncbi:sodium-dependent transporter [Blautia sp.]|uniref:sodium-dependent transporter n=1 Tax=Blautia sp. TaxID=1955243 RepID=UPI00258DEE32|nr:sodium-dependent transporter [Blautia sp.]